MGKVILICGKIGSGKSTYAENLAKDICAVNISQDELMFSLFGQELYEKNPNQYEQYCSIIEAYVKRKAGEIAKSGGIAICENGFWSRSERDELRKYYKDMQVKCELHYIDISEEQRLLNIQKRNHEVSNGKQHFFLTDETLINHFFEVPTEDEIDFRISENIL